jgi:hypothetical protein
MRRNALVGVLGLVAAACTTARQRPLTALPAAGTTAQVEALARQALALDAVLDRAADTLYSSDAVVFANARRRLGVPRFAAVGVGGRVTVAGVAVTVEGAWAWALLDYRWFNVAQNQAEAGRATLICARRESGWRIVHLHSSQLLPWDR